MRTVLIEGLDGLHRGFGWKPGKFHRDARRMMFSLEIAKSLAPTNPRFSTGLPPIWDQGQIGSCTAHGNLRAFLFAAAKAGFKYEMLSRLMLYYNERAIEGTTSDDAGAEIHDGIKSIIEQGVCLESLWPYDTTRFSEKPPAQCFTDALQHQGLKTAGIAGTVDQVKSAMAAGYTVVIGFPCYQSIQSVQTTRTGIIPVPRSGERMVGGHCVCTNGQWDDSRQLIGIDNSWSEQWGIQGSGFLPYAYFNGPVSDCQVIYTVEGEGDLPIPVPVDSQTWQVFAAKAVAQAFGLAVREPSQVGGLFSVHNN